MALLINIARADLLQFTTPVAQLFYNFCINYTFKKASAVRQLLYCSIFKEKISSIKTAAVYVRINSTFKKTSAVPQLLYLQENTGLIYRPSVCSSRWLIAFTAEALYRCADPVGKTKNNATTTQ